MDGSRFDTWTRRRFGLAAGRTAALLGLAGGLPSPTEAKNKKTCKNGKKKCGKKCIAKSKCCGGCGGQTCCDGKCKDLATDGANCGACGNACVLGDCIHGACRCGNGMPVCGDGCSCGARAEGGDPACFSAPFFGTCDEDADCPVGSVCLVNNKCSSPCLG
ncbi:MAG: hypothetical protein ACRDJC_10855 [Thermomicrobiales bacterium]